MKDPIRILFLTDNFPPESNAPANRTYEHCREWVKAGAEVTVITCHPNFPKGKIFPGYKNRLRCVEQMDGIKVIRVWSYITPNRGFVKRILDYMSFSVSSFFAGLFYKTDVIVATSPQLFTALSGYWLSVFKRKPWIMEVRDLWPESIVAVDAMTESFALRRLQKLVDFLYKKSNRLIVVTDTFKERLSNDGVDVEKIRVVKNGVNVERFRSFERIENLRRKYGLEDKFIVGYIGTHGMAHNLDFILDCAKKIKDQQIHFLFIGDGAFKGRLEKKKETENIQNVTMLDAISRDMVPSNIDILDVALIPLKKTDTFKSVIPSKIFENAAMGKPILLGVEGEARKIIDDYHAGIAFEPENESDFIEKLELLKNDQKLYRSCQDGCNQLANDFKREKLANDMLDCINEVVENSSQVEFFLLRWPSGISKPDKNRKKLAKLLDVLLLTLILLVVIFMAFF